MKHTTTDNTPLITVMLIISIAGCFLGMGLAIGSIMNNTELETRIERLEYDNKGLTTVIENMVEVEEKQYKILDRLTRLIE